MNPLANRPIIVARYTSTRDIPAISFLLLTPGNERMDGLDKIQTRAKHQKHHTRSLYSYGIPDGTPYQRREQ